MSDRETIAAIATPPGTGGVAILRISGPAVTVISSRVAGTLPRPRYATFTRFRDDSGAVIDEGLALFFPGPGSFTGEDVLELQGHGGAVVMDQLLQRVLQCGARLAEPGEFTRRAFLNGKLDLAQAEAVADLIESGSAAAARLAIRTLEGEFSSQVERLLERLVQLRIYVEAAIDFPEEEVDFLTAGKVSTNLQGIIESVGDVEKSARVGRLLRDGLTLVIAGRPNAGKSSLLNALAGYDSAIVTAAPGTTRDLLRERIQIDGIPLHLVDTAGIRESSDQVEQEGIRRARIEIEKADRVLWIYDAGVEKAEDLVTLSELPPDIPITLIRNKIDLVGEIPAQRETGVGPELALSATSGAGLEQLRQHLKQSVGYTGDQEGEFIARRRHLDAIRRAREHLHTGQRALLDSGSGELLAEDLRQAQNALGEITGSFTPDDLLGRIFSSFCIGK